MLGNDDNANCVVEAAAYLAHPDLLPLLTAFDDPDDGYLAIALTECDPQRRGQRDEFGWAVVEQIRALHPELHVALDAAATKSVPRCSWPGRRSTTIRLYTT
jgi:hypothetical protein